MERGERRKRVLGWIFVDFVVVLVVATSIIGKVLVMEAIDF